MTPDLVSLFDALARPSVDREMLVYSGAEVPGFPHRIAKAPDGQPALLLATGGEQPIASPSFTLEHLSIRHGARCRVRSEATGILEDATFSIVQCVRGDRVMQLHFLRAVGSALLSLGAAPTGGQLAEALATLVALFRAMTYPPRKAIQGLWGELFVIAEANDPARLVRGWHRSPEELFDFADGSARIEVKSAGDRTRRHYFRLEQLDLPDVEILIASLFVSPMGGGASAHDLIVEIHKHVHDHDLSMMIERVVASTLGNQWETAIAARFDRELARGSLAFFGANDVPAPACIAPATVTEIRFRSDLADAAIWSPVVGVAELFAAAMPSRAS